MPAPLPLPPDPRRRARRGGRRGPEPAAGRGAGATLPGKVTLAVAPRALAELAAGRTSVVVTGTNGKTTTTAFLVAALGDHDVVTNATGANLPTGIVTALAGSRAGLAVLETDELHVPAVMAATRPRALVLLNLSRDQLDRTHEVRRAADLWRTAIGVADEPLTVVANAADPNVAWAALDGASTGTTVVWVDGGLHWLGDAELCPRCGELLDTDDSGWSSSCGLRQPDAAYRVAEGDRGHAVLLLPDGEELALAPTLPGAANLSNAAFAVAAAAALGVDPAEAVDRLSHISDVAGRYSTVALGTPPAATRPARLLLAKNPAGWTVALELIEPDAVVALGVNARTADGADTSWLWDVPFERLAGRTVGVFGPRRRPRAAARARRCHLATRTGSGCVTDAHALATALPDGALTVLATYTAFEEVRRGA